MGGGGGEFSFVQGDHGEIEGGVNSWSRETRAQNRIQGESKKKFELRRLVQKCTFFPATLLYGNFFFGTPIAKKNPRTFFFLSKSKV